MTVDEMIKRLRASNDKKINIDVKEIGITREEFNSLANALKEDLRDNENPTFILKLNLNPAGCEIDKGTHQVKMKRLVENFGVQKNVINTILDKHIDNLVDELGQYLVVCLLDTLTK